MYLVKMRGRCHNLFYFTYIYYIMNLSFKIPQWLFILVIVVLVIFVLYKLCSTRESLVNYNSTVSFDNGLVNFPGVTDASCFKLYDNNYYWPETGTIIRVFGRDPAAATATPDTAVDADLDYVIVYDRNGNESAPINSSSFDVTNTIDDTITSILSLETTPAGTKLAAGQQLSPAFYEWYTLPVAPPAPGSQDTNYSTIVTNQLFYATFNLDTYIHIVDKDDNGDYLHNGFFESNGVVTKEAYNAVDVKNVSYVANPDSYSVGTVNGEVIAGKTLNDCYRLGAFLYMSLHTGDLYLLTTDNEGNDQLVQYKRSNGSSTNSITVPTTGIIPSNSTKFLVADERGGNVIVYVAIQQYTLIMILNLQSDGSFKLPASNGVWRMGSDGPITFAFGESGDDDSDSDNGDENNGDDDSDSDNGDDSDSDSDSDDDENNNGGNNNGENNEGGSDYWKWYWYWNSTNTPPGGFSDDYMLKTEVVPPVCPACPAYQVNCGGNGNMGSKGSSGSQGTNLSDAVGTTVTTAGDVAGKALDSGTAALDKTLDTASDLLKSTGSGAMQLTNTVLDSAGNLVSGTADLARDTATGTVGLARDTVTGTVDLAQDTASNTADFVRDMNYGSHRTGSATGSSAAGYYQQHGTMMGYQANNYFSKD